ncbi:MAG: ribosome maturation factor RimM [Alphaproteobacteria bacterium]
MGKLVLVGSFGAPVGLKGEVRLQSFTADPAAIADYGPLVTQDGRAYEIVSLRQNAGGLVARVAGIATREAAEGLKGLALHAPRERLPAGESEDYYHADLVGLSAVLGSGAPFGKVISVQNFGAGDLLEIAPAGGAGSTVLVPFTKAAVPLVDLAGGRVVVAPPPGLLEPAVPEGEAS